ncbi:MAG: PQQ-dependent sugar dehydrogenase [Bdellovibrionota bacterium]
MKLRYSVLLPLLAVVMSGCGGGGGGGSDSAATGIKVEAVATGLSFPVGVAAAPDGRTFFTELRSGNVRIFQDGAVLNEPFATLQVPAEGADGLLGIAVDPDFASNGFVYVFQSIGNPVKNRVIRLTDSHGVGTALTVIVNDLPNGGHNGGKMAFGHDGSLFISTGDAAAPDSAQDPRSFAGKILHVSRNGEALSSSSPIFALGFRNVFGMAVHPDSGTLYATDNGPDCDDEINRIEAGGNYGWRLSQPCGETDPQFVQPLFRINPTVGVTGATFYSGDALPELRENLLVGDYNTGTIRRFEVDDPSGGVNELAPLVPGNGSPVLDLTVGADGNVYFTGQDALYRISRAD